MKQIILLALIIQHLTFNIYSFAQGVGINDNGVQPDASSMLDVISTTKGVLLPRVNTSQMTSISSPATGLTVFNTDSLTFCFYDGTQWKCLCTCYTIIQDSLSCGDSIIDSRDGQKYATVKIGTQCWMAENLNVGTMINLYTGLGNPYNNHQTNNVIIEKFCYKDSLDYCNGTNGKVKSGGLYEWDELMQYTTSTPNQGICPTGWHIPTDAEWITMEEAIGMCTGITPGCSGAIGCRGTDQGNQIKLLADCYTGGGYTNCGTSCFYAILGGGTLDGSNFYFGNYGVYAMFWTSTQYNTSNAISRMMWKSDSCIRRGNNSKKAIAYSLRCVKN